MSGIKRFLPHYAKDKGARRGFLDLPYEIRQLIYQEYFVDCFVRYHHAQRIPGCKALTRVAHCQGPQEYHLLATCRQIYNEALPFLTQTTYVLIDGKVDAESAIWNMGSTTMSPFLRSLITSTKKLVLSNPAEKFCSTIPQGCSLPRFDRLETIEIFGFFPSLTTWLYRNRAISMGWSWWHWNILGWKSAPRMTKNRRIQLTDAAKWLHQVTTRDADELTILLNAWEYESHHRADKYEDLYHVLIDVDRRRILERERLQRYPKKDFRLRRLKGECEEYHQFLTATDKRRTAWRGEEHST